MGSFWSDFLELNTRRQQSDSGFSPLTFTEISCWCNLVKIEVSQFWLDTIDMLDQVWFKVQSQK